MEILQHASVCKRRASLGEDFLYFFNQANSANMKPKLHTGLKNPLIPRSRPELNPEFVEGVLCKRTRVQTCALRLGL